ncbi:MAG: FliO/MopB family protein [Polyangiaceae bacterium]
MPSYSGYLIETFVTLAVVCGIAVAILWGARRMGLGHARGPIELLGQLPLDARRSIYLVKVGEQVLVVGIGEGGMTKLGELCASDLPLPAATKNATFKEALARTWQRRATP